MIKEEHQPNPMLLRNYQHSSPKKTLSFSSSLSSSSSSSKILVNADKDDNEMDYNVDHHLEKPLLCLADDHSLSQSFLHPYPLIAQHLAIPTTTASYIP